jgi:hypothetical protein
MPQGLVIMGYHELPHPPPFKKGVWDAGSHRHTVGGVEEESISFCKERAVLPRPIDDELEEVVLLVPMAQYVVKFRR